MLLASSKCRSIAPSSSISPCVPPHSACHELPVLSSRLTPLLSTVGRGQRMLQNVPSTTAAGPVFSWVPALFLHKGSCQGTGDSAGRGTGTLQCQGRMGLITVLPGVVALEAEWERGMSWSSNLAEGLSPISGLFLVLAEPPKHKNSLKVLLQCEYAHSLREGPSSGARLGCVTWGQRGDGTSARNISTTPRALQGSAAPCSAQPGLGHPGHPRHSEAEGCCQLQDKAPPSPISLGASGHTTLSSFCFICHLLSHLQPQLRSSGLPTLSSLAAPHVPAPLNPSERLR